MGKDNKITTYRANMGNSLVRSIVKVYDIILNTIFYLLWEFDYRFLCPTVSWNNIMMLANEKLFEDFTAVKHKILLSHIHSFKK